MIESGLGLTSACLPTIYALFKKKSFFNKTDNRYRERDGSMSSDTRMVIGVGGPATIDTYALKELDPISQKREPPSGRIFVKKSFHTTDNAV